MKRRPKRCVVCKGPRPFNPQRGVPWEAYWDDPFCSTTCAKKYFKTDTSSLKPTKHGILKHGR
jgi:hypothetical protein